MTIAEPQGRPEPGPGVSRPPRHGQLPADDSKRAMRQFGTSFQNPTQAGKGKPFAGLFFSPVSHPAPKLTRADRRA